MCPSLNPRHVASLCRVMRCPWLAAASRASSRRRRPFPPGFVSWALHACFQIILPFFLFISLPLPTANSGNLCSALSLRLSRRALTFEVPSTYGIHLCLRDYFSFCVNADAFPRQISSGAPYPNSSLLRVTDNFTRPFPGGAICQFHRHIPLSAKKKWVSPDHTCFS